MSGARIALGGLAAALWCLPVGAAGDNNEFRGAAVLEHPAGKVAVRSMSLAHAGKIDEMVLLGTKAMQSEWKAMPAEDRTMMGEMMKEFSFSDADFKDRIVKFGVLTVDGDKAMLVVQEETKDSDGSGSQTLTQRFALEDGAWRVSR